MFAERVYFKLINRLGSKNYRMHIVYIDIGSPGELYSVLEKCVGKNTRA